MNLLLSRILARWVSAHETAGHPFSRRGSRFGTLTCVVSQEERSVGLGRSHGGRQRQAGPRSLHQTFPLPEHHGPLLVSRHIPARKIRQEHLPQRSLHWSFKNPRNQLSMRNLLLQAFPTQWQDVQDTFRKATERTSYWIFIPRAATDVVS